MRIDVMLDMQGDPGSRYAVVDDFYDGLAYTLTTLVYDADPPLRAASSRYAYSACRAIRCPNPILPRPNVRRSCCRAA